jgi:hypothetical protein
MDAKRKQMIRSYCETGIITPKFAPDQPKPGTTYCNQFVSYVVEGVTGYKALQSKNANQIVVLMAAGGEWVPCPIERALKLVAEGELLLAGETGKAHGHVVVLVDGAPASSGKWKMQESVPLCANVGQENWIDKGLNYAFSGKTPPRIWALNL